MYPIMYLGIKAVTRFKKEYRGPIREVFNIEDVREFVSYYQGFKALPYDLVLEDVSRLAGNALSSLLKFTEESTLNLAYLAMFGRISPILLSRMVRVVKEEEEIKSEFLSVREGYKFSQTLEKDLHNLVKVKRVVEKSPLMGVYMASPRYRDTLKIFRVLG